MAKNQKSSAEEESTVKTYKFYGSKNQGETVDRVIIEGTSSQPKRHLEVGGGPETLTEEQVKQYRAMGLELREFKGDSEPLASTEAEPKTQEDQQAAQAPNAGLAETETK